MTTPHPVMLLSKRTFQSSLLIFILCIGLGCNNIQDDAASSIRVISFNIRYNNPDDGDHAWPNRAERVASTIRFYQADLVGVQEALKEQLENLSSHLPEYQWIGVGRDDGQEAGEYSAILYKKDRFEVLDNGTFWLSETPDQPGSQSWDAALPRIATWGQFKDRHTLEEIFHFNTHFDHRGDQARTESAALIVEKAVNIAGDTPLVVTGDFNFIESAPGYTTLTNKLNDAFYISEEPHHGPEATIYGGFEVTHQEGRRIDYIFVNDHFKVIQHATLSDNWDGAFASDHLAVFSKLVVNEYR